MCARKIPAIEFWTSKGTTMKLAHTLLAGAALAVSMASAVQAADLLQPADPIYSSQLFDFEGLYLGATGGGALSGGSLYGTLGVVVGANFAVTDGILAGVEFQGDTYWNGAGYAAYDALALGRVGGFISDNVLLYGDLGAGFVNATGVYAFGGGAEMGLTSQLSVRGDLQAIGAFGTFPSTAKATVGLLWHMD
jgi:outer membrane immunogenic protein